MSVRILHLTFLIFTSHVFITRLELVTFCVSGRCSKPIELYELAPVVYSKTGNYFVRGEGEF
jgi:hypothetical protein